MNLTVTQSYYILVTVWNLLGETPAEIPQQFATREACVDVAIPIREDALWTLEAYRTSGKDYRLIEAFYSKYELRQPHLVIPADGLTVSCQMRTTVEELTE